MFDKALLTKMYKIDDLQDVGVLCLNASLNLNESNRKVTLEQLCQLLAVSPYMIRDKYQKFVRDVLKNQLESPQSTLFHILLLFTERWDEFVEQRL